MGALDALFGMFFNGMVISSSLFGINVLQCYIYFRSYGRDHFIIKATVASTLLLDTLGMLFLAKGIYGYLITEWGNPSSLEYLDYGVCIQSLVAVFIAAIVQCFFIHSIYVVSLKNRFITGFILFLWIAALGSGIAVNIEALVRRNTGILADTHFKILLGLFFNMSVFCDLATTTSLCYLLRKAKSGFRHTDTLVDKIIVYALSRGILTFILQALETIFFVALPDSDLAWTLIHFCLSKVYTISLLVTLNRRDTHDSQEEVICLDISSGMHSGVHV
ncbi:hypothetical protein BT96DRAFT_975848 [Gymnopus androsaceus JB14]|uniref:DUF6534 domain-containing protein n=1 Tax=Gymnopus androsaceus JB14 TaxID=1447944 RepID=A0A6A4HLU9_9AGAR|nr:hypothetical protein BT96DRAFT_975848 [Gymnopus androsaceus JB14]